MENNINIAERSWVVTGLWVYYFIMFLVSLASIFIYASAWITSGGNILTQGGAILNVAHELIFSIVEFVAFGILFFVCMKRKRGAIKIVPSIELGVFVISLAYTSYLASERLEDDTLDSALLISIIFSLIRPILATLIVYKNKTNFSN